MTLKEIHAEELLEALSGIACLVDHDGTIVALSERKWKRYAIVSETPELADPSTVIGKSLYSFIRGELGHARAPL